ncbi:conserved hypothetical protein [Magnetospirillum sp. SS-4]|nr:conserved hypothetical protein [Magnetospirillum sp. SS-4]
MVDVSRGIGSAGLGGPAGGIRDSFNRESRPARDVAAIGPGLGASPNGPRGRRMLAPDTPLDSLDRGAPRGTYIDLLI